MPLLPHSAYWPPLPFRNGHVQTVYPALFRKLAPLPFRRERIRTQDGDFIDLDWLEHHAPRTQPRTHWAQEPVLADSRQPPALAILTHGLEGSTSQTYIRGMARALFANGYDVLAWNFRGCSGEPNQRLRSYHSGATDDLECVIAHACTPSPRDIALVGFSLGGNIVLKYLGQLAATAGEYSASPGAKLVATEKSVLSPAPRAHVIGAVAISVPCDLAGSTTVLERRSNRIYMERFLTTLRHKIREKHQRFPGVIDIAGLDQIRTFRAFDDRYTAPLHGFRDADHYWHACSCLRQMEHIAVPTLLLNAADDPFLSPGCYPVDIAQAHPFLHLEMPRHGGHVGFVRHRQNGLYYSELRACAFLSSAASMRSRAAAKIARGQPKLSRM